MPGRCRRARSTDVLISGSVKDCKEALMCLGDKPEAAFPSYRQTLAGFGHRTTIEYVARACEMAIGRASCLTRMPA
jgi:FO synthase